MKILIYVALSIAIISGVGFAYAQSDPIPTWIKDSAGWWSNDEIEDKEFFEMIQFLINREIITIPNNQDDSKRVQELELKLSQLKKQTISDIQNAYDKGYNESGSYGQPSLKTQSVKPIDRPYVCGGAYSSKYFDVEKLECRSVGIDVSINGVESDLHVFDIDDVIIIEAVRRPEPITDDYRMSLAIRNALTGEYVFRDSAEQTIENMGVASFSLGLSDKITNGTIYYHHSHVLEQKSFMINEMIVSGMTYDVDVNSGVLESWTQFRVN